ncbi:MAG TPA: T9SS type A sorting domain-containing protein [Candidatus Kapabacteria bacterium]
MNPKHLLSLFLLVLALAAPASAQLNGAGTRFIFALPEGPERISGNETPTITLRIMSAYKGSGKAILPGQVIDFTFEPFQVTSVALPANIAITDESYTIVNKYIIVTTTQPASLVVHRFMPFAGDATQIYPDSQLGKEYIVSSWGIFNDVGENNFTQLVVTATNPETMVSITPNIAPLGGEAGVTRSILLGTGESVIVKADSKTASGERGFSGTTIKATAPVSVITNVTCGYVPIGNQACNEMLDQLLPKSHVDEGFFISPLSNTDHPGRVIFVSDSMNFTVLTGRGLLRETSTGWLEMSITAPEVFSVSQKAQCYLATVGSDVYANSDPSLVTILPRSDWQDTMVWYSPKLFTGSGDLANYVTIVYPRDRGSEVLLDGNSVTSLRTPDDIPQSQMSAVQIPVEVGVHKITSPVPVFAVVSGFDEADAYTFLPFGVGKFIVSVPKGTNLGGFEVYPNPASRFLTIKAPTGNYITEVKVTDVLGIERLTQSGLYEELELDVSKLISGRYVLTMQTTEGERFTPFLILR